METAAKGSRGRLRSLARRNLVALAHGVRCSVAPTRGVGSSSRISNPSSSSGESIANLFELEDVVEDGCWFNALCTRLKPSHAIELTVVSLDRNVAATVALT